MLAEPNERSDIAAQVQEHPWGQRIRPIEQVTSGQVGYCSIHAFKGLEAPVVIITGIESMAGQEQSRSLFYVGVTRALHKLYVLMHERVKNEILELLGL